MGMKKITKAELEVFLRKHKLWLIDDPEGERANLRCADLYGADLRCADLSGADLSGADLYGADLYGADLYGADLSGTDLRCADLYGADLRCADLSGADLSGADLYGADLYGANLRCADLYGANLETAKNVYHPLACPEEGSFTAFKKVCGNYIVKLEIPEDALRCSATSRKCRASHAKVISFTNLDGTPADVDVAYSSYDETFAYRVGEIVKADKFDPNRWHECAPGIHFFITRQEAVDY